MAILIDAPRWAAHGTTWAHVVSDASLAELHAFARRTGLPERAFDLDHYDAPAHAHARLVAAGALSVDRRELIHRLRASGLRVAAADRPAERARRRLGWLRERWQDTVGPAPSALAVGEALLVRWSEPHRRYHDTTHLAAVLEHLDILAGTGHHLSRATVLAAWFHDAVHDGAAEDERRSAELVAELGRPAGLSAPEQREVQRLVLLTVDHAPAPGDGAGAALCDADLAILAAPPHRYRSYVSAVRREYGHLSAAAFAEGRAQVLRALLARPHLFATAHGRESWEEPARANVRAELEKLGD